MALFLKLPSNSSIGGAICNNRRGLARFCWGPAGRLRCTAKEDEILLPLQRPLAEDSFEDAKAVLPPRICTLREFGRSGEGMVAMDPDATVSAFLSSLAANVEFSFKVQDWEILSGRLAMMVFACAVTLEALTGNSVFQKIDSQRLLEFSAAAAISALVAAVFAVALQAKIQVPYTVSKKYEALMNALIDNVIDGLLFDEKE